PTSRPSTKADSPASRQAPGSACSRPREHRRVSSPGSTPRSINGWRVPMPAKNFSAKARKPPAVRRSSSRLTFVSRVKNGQRWSRLPARRSIDRFAAHASPLGRMDFSRWAQTFQFTSPPRKRRSIRNGRNFPTSVTPTKAEIHSKRAQLSNFRHPRESGDPFCDRQERMDSRLVTKMSGNDDIKVRGALAPPSPPRKPKPCGNKRHATQRRHRPEPRRTRQREQIEAA